jgi:hypothetical protein
MFSKRYSLLLLVALLVATLGARSAEEESSNARIVIELDALLSEAPQQQRRVTPPVKDDEDDNGGSSSSRSQDEDDGPLPSSFDTAELSAVVWLASHPHSGSHLVRRLVEAATARPTFSVYREDGMFAHSMLGLSSPLRSSSSVEAYMKQLGLPEYRTRGACDPLVVKTHFPVSLCVMPSTHSQLCRTYTYILPYLGQAACKPGPVARLFACRQCLPAPTMIL